MQNFQEKVSFIWSVADLLRGDYKRSEYQHVILPLTVLKRLDQVLAPTKKKVLARNAKLTGGRVKNVEPVLNRAAGLPFHNTSRYTFETLVQDPDHLAANLQHYIQCFSKKAREILEHFRFDQQIQRLADANLLFKVVSKFNEIDLHPDRVSNVEMGYVYEELIRKFSELSNETAGEHFTPREVIRMMVDVVLHEDEDALRMPGTIRTVYDPACGTGGMLTTAEDYVRELNPEATIEVFGQELNGFTYAVCNSDMLVKGKDPEHIIKGNSFSEDGHEGRTFDYMLTNPPFGVEWKKVEQAVRDEHNKLGYAGRFGAGLPRISDGQLLFLQHMVSKMNPIEKGGSRIGIVMNGSPLFSGGAGSGESEIRRWILENDWLEAIVALPDNMFYNTGIQTYVWFLTNRKHPDRKGKVQLINATSFYQKMRKSLGEKRHEMSKEHITQVVKLHGDHAEGKLSKIFPNEAFGYRRVTIERPLRLSFQATPERIARLEQERAFQNLAKSRKKGKKGQEEVLEGEAEQKRVLKALQSLPQDKTWNDRDAFDKALTACMKNAGVKLAVPVRKVIINALGERDENAAVCVDKKGNPEPDTGLRDYENVPLGEDVRAYFEREVKPHVPDAWIDERKRDEKDGEIGTVGYEIPFNRHFYEYTPPRPLEEIDAEIKELEGEILELLKEVAE